MGERNRVAVSIASTEYYVCGDESPEYIHQVASLVDKKVKEIMRSDPSLSITQAAMLTAINLGDESLRRNTIEAENIRKLRELEKRLKASIDEGDALRKEIQAARETLVRIKQELVRCENENRAIREQLRSTKSEGG